MKFTSESFKKAAEILKVLGHPVRIEIIRFLNSKKNQKYSVKQIQEALGLEQVETSRHLLTLKYFSVLVCDKEGTSSYYAISGDPFVQNLVLCLSKKLQPK